MTGHPGPTSFSHIRPDDSELRLTIDIDGQAIRLTEGDATVTVTVEDLRWIVLTTGPAALDTLKKAGMS